MRTHPNRLTKEELEYLYWKEETNTPEIAETIGVSKTSVLNWMREYDIPRRSQSESLSLTLKKLWQEPKYRATMMGYLREYWSRSDERSENAKTLWKNPEFRSKMSQIQKDIWKRPKHIAKMSKVRKRMWQNPEYRNKRIEEGKKRWQNPKFREKMVVAYKKAWESPERRENMRQSSRELWKTPEYREKVVRNVIRAIHNRPTKPEKKLIDIIQQYNLPFNYVGDGALIVGTLNPDFIHNNGKKKIIEVFGRVFHDPEKSFFEVSWKRQYWGRMAYYSQLGYDCLFLWDDDLNDEQEIAEKVRGFVNG